MSTNCTIFRDALKIDGRSTKYFQVCVDDREAKGFFVKWTDKDTLHLIRFVTDVLYVYRRFYQSFKDDSILIFDIAKKKNILIAWLDEMKKRPLAGGLEENFLNNLPAVNSGDITKPPDPHI